MTLSSLSHIPRQFILMTQGISRIIRHLDSQLYRDLQIDKLFNCRWQYIFCIGLYRCYNVHFQDPHITRLYKSAVLHMKIALISGNVYFERRRFWNECQVTRSKFNSPMYRASSVPVNSISSRSWRLELLIVLALSMLGWLWNRDDFTAIGVFSGFGLIELAGEVFRCCAKNPFVPRPSLSVRIPAGNAKRQIISFL